ncbi:MAG: tRNA pseudouridine(13) synthase TruD [Francisellaceae bacterium]
METTEKSAAIGVLKQHITDFIVDEELGFSLTGEGEHIWLYIEKEGRNTQDVIRDIARFSGLKRSDIGYSGLKDKHATTRQWLSLYYPGKQDIDWQHFDSEGVRLLIIKRHNKKLKIGTHKSNHFHIIIRDLNYRHDDIKQRLESISQNGFINYYGQQRFGRDNLEKAQAFIDGQIKLKNHKDRGFLFSVIRSFLYNRYIDKRLETFGRLEPLNGDIVGFCDGRTFFRVQEGDIPDIQARLTQKELAVAAPLIGKPGKLFYEDEALAFYQDFNQKHDAMVAFLKADFELAFRPMICHPQQLSFDFDETENLLTLNFSLPSGAFATTLIDQLIPDHDASL